MCVILCIMWNFLKKKNALPVEAQNEMHSTKFHLTYFTNCAFTSYYTFFNQLSSSAVPTAKYTLSNLSELWFGIAAPAVASNKHVYIASEK